MCERFLHLAWHYDREKTSERVDDELTTTIPEVGTGAFHLFTNVYYDLWPTRGHTARLRMHNAVRDRSGGVVRAHTINENHDRDDLSSRVEKIVLILFFPRLFFRISFTVTK